jgi:hypothetical protein
MPVEDSYIAATARRYGLTIATGNEQDFRRPGLKVYLPACCERITGKSETDPLRASER